MIFTWLLTTAIAVGCGYVIDRSLFSTRWFNHGFDKGFIAGRENERRKHIHVV